MSFLNSVLKVFVGDKSKQDVKAITPIVNQVKTFEKYLINELTLESCLQTYPTLNTPKPITDMMATAEQQLAQVKLTPYLKEVTQPTADKIDLTLRDIPFDQAIDWLQLFTKTYRVKVTALRSTKTTKFGAVILKMTLRKVKNRLNPK